MFIQNNNTDTVAFTVSKSYYKLPCISKDKISFYGSVLFLF